MDANAAGVVVTTIEARRIAKLCTLRGLVEHGNAIRASLNNDGDAQAALLETWAAAQAIATYCGDTRDGKRAQRIADLIATHAEGQRMPASA